MTPNTRKREVKRSAPLNPSNAKLGCLEEANDRVNSPLDVGVLMVVSKIFIHCSCLPEASQILLL